MLQKHQILFCCSCGNTAEVRSKEQLKTLTEDVGELKLIIRTTDELVDDIEDIHWNLNVEKNVANKMLDENKAGSPVAGLGVEWVDGQF